MTVFKVDDHVYSDNGGSRCTRILDSTGAKVAVFGLSQELIEDCQLQANSEEAAALVLAVAEQMCLIWSKQLGGTGKLRFSQFDADDTKRTLRNEDFGYNVSENELRSLSAGGWTDPCIKTN